MSSLHAPSSMVNIFTLKVHVLKLVVAVEEQEKNATDDIIHSSNSNHERLLQVDSFHLLADLKVVL